MSLRPDPSGPVPADTARAVHAAFRKGNLYVRIREEGGTISQDDVCAEVFSHTGQPAEAPWRLALVCALHYLEDHSDRQAADAVRARMDWKYLLGLELTDPGFDAPILTEFRARLIAHDAGRRIFDHLVERLSERDLSWCGDKVHLSEACDEEVPHLIAHVVTTGATKTDVEQTEAIHHAPAERDLLPTTHLVDAGYVDAELVLQSRDRSGIELVGPMSQNHQWQAKAGPGYDLACFTFDWQAKQATCPQGKQSVKWTERTDQHGHPRL